MRSLRLACLAFAFGRAGGDTGAVREAEVDGAVLDDGLHGWEVAWLAPFLSGGGYASEATSFVLGLSKLLPSALRIAQFAEQPAAEFVEGLPDDVYAALARLARPPDPKLRLVAVCHSTPDLWVPSRYPGWDETEPCPPRHASVTVGRTMYESDRLPADWVARCLGLDEIWVPTAFHRDSFARSGVPLAKLFVLPEPVDVHFFDPQRHAPLALPPVEGGAESPFVFLSVFKWEARKGWDLLLEAFLTEFARAEPVALYIKTSPFHGPADFGVRIDALVRTLGLDAAAIPLQLVRVLDRELPLSALPRLYRAADAFVLPSRGEGWGRPHAEAMAMGLPVIATNWSGPTAFLNEENGFPVRVASLRPVETLDETLRAEGHLWAEPDVAHLRQRMRFVYEHREEARARGRRAREHMARHFSAEIVAKATHERLVHLAKTARPAGVTNRDELRR